MSGSGIGLHVELLLRIAVATALGAVIGLERQIHRRPAGLRTHMLVALASATFMVVSTHFVYFQHYQKDDLVTVDPSRIAASVVAGTSVACCFIPPKRACTTRAPTSVARTAGTMRRKSGCR